MWDNCRFFLRLVEADYLLGLRAQGDVRVDY